MPKLGSDGTNATGFQNYAKDWYEAYIKGVSIQPTRQTGGTMLVIDWKPDDTEEAKKNTGSIREWVMVNGHSPTGEPYRTDKFFDRLDALDIRRDYVCCGKLGSKEHFVKKNGKYHCPHCNAVPGMNQLQVDSNEDQTMPWTNLRARIQVDIEKQDGTDIERNRIQRVVALGSK